MDARGRGAGSVTRVLWAAHWNPPRAEEQGVVRPGWAYCQGLTHCNANHKTASTDMIFPNATSHYPHCFFEFCFCFTFLSLTFINKSNKQKAAVMPWTYQPFLGHSLYQGQDKTREDGIHLQGIEVRPKANAGAAGHEVHHNTCYKKQHRRGWAHSRWEESM